MKTHRTIAVWPKGVISYNDPTTDDHDSLEQAEGVARLLKREGLGGERIHFPVSVTIQEITQP